jgi:hypothetical protein
MVLFLRRCIFLSELDMRKQLLQSQRVEICLSVAISHEASYQLHNLEGISHGLLSINGGSHRNSLRQEPSLFQSLDDNLHTFILA